MKKERKGQAAFEYILVAAVIGIMIIPAAYLFFSYSHSSADQIDKAQLDQLGRNIVAEAEKVYYQGPPSRTELEARMPPNVLNISIIGDWNTGTQELLIKSGGPNGVSEFTYPSKVNIKGSFNGSMRDISVGAGIKKIEIEAYETSGGTSFVNVNFGGRCPPSVVYDFNTDGQFTAAIDGLFFLNCYCNTEGYPKYRPSKTWQSGWLDNIGLVYGGNPYAVCVNADYNGDCAVDNTDRAQFCSGTGLVCNPVAC